MEVYIKQYGITIVGVLLGALVGFLYYKYVGCIDGTCAITANPYMSIIYGSMMGGLLFSNFK